MGRRWRGKTGETSGDGVADLSVEWPVLAPNSIQILPNLVTNITKSGHSRDLGHRRSHKRGHTVEFRPGRSET